MDETHDLARRTAIVTGGARGIGRAACELLAERGCRLVVNYQSSQEAADELVAAVRTRGGRRGVRTHRHPGQQRGDHPRHDRAQT